MTAVKTEGVNFDLYADLTSYTPAFIASGMREYSATAVRTSAFEPAIAEFLLRKIPSGTVRVQDDEGTGFDLVIRRVATKGGITEEGVKVLEVQFPSVFDEVFMAMERRRLIQAKELGERGSDSFPGEKRMRRKAAPVQKAGRSKYFHMFFF